MKITSGCAAVLVGIFLVAGSAVSTAQDAPRKPIKIEINVTTKLIQVAVTDRKGNPVLDLAPADFEVKDDGKAVKIDYLEKHNYGGGEVANPVSAGRSLTRKFFFIFDFTDMDPNGIVKSRETALRFIDTALDPGDEIGLVACTESRDLALIEFLTTDHKSIRESIASFGPKRLAGRADSLMGYYLTQKNVASGTGTAGRDPWFERLVQGYMSDFQSERKSGYVGLVLSFMESMKHLARTLRVIPGNKNILFFSDGIPRQFLFGRRASALVEAENPSDATSWAKHLGQNDVNLGDSSIQDAFTEMLDEFEAANCPVYSFLTTTPGTRIRSLSGDDSLRQLASSSGGRYYHNTMDINAAVADVKQATGVYYILGYNAPGEADGAFHKVKVNVARKGVKVQAQSGYFDPKPFAEYTDFEKTLHLMDAMLSESTPLSLTGSFSLVPMPIRGEDLNLFSAYALLPAETMGELLGPKTEAMVFIADRSGNDIVFNRFFLGDLPKGREGMFLELGYPLRLPGFYEVRLVLRNIETGRTARGIASFQIPETSGVWLDPLLLLEEGRNLVLFNPTPDASLSAYYRYDPALYFPRTGDVPLGTRKILAVVRCHNMNPEADVKFIGWVLRSGSEERTDVVVTVLDQAVLGTVRIVRLEISVADLPAGTYSLNVNAGAADAWTVPLATASFNIR